MMFETCQSQKHWKPMHQSTVALTTWIQDGTQDLVGESFGGGGGEGLTPSLNVHNEAGRCLHMVPKCLT